MDGHDVLVRLNRDALPAGSDPLEAAGILWVAQARARGNSVELVSLDVPDHTRDIAVVAVNKSTRLLSLSEDDQVSAVALPAVQAR